MENTVAGTDIWTYSNFSIECLVSEHELLKYAEGIYIELRTGDTVIVKPVLREIGRDSWTMTNALQLLVLSDYLVGNYVGNLSKLTL